MISRSERSMRNNKFQENNVMHVCAKYSSYWFINVTVALKIKKKEKKETNYLKMQIILKMLIHDIN